MKTDDKAAWRPRRFDVAGAHPDEVYRAVAEVSAAVDEIGKQFQRFTGMVPGCAAMAAEQALALRPEPRRRCAAVSGAGRPDHGRFQRGNAARFKRQAPSGAQSLQRAGAGDGEGAGAAAGRRAAGRFMEVRENPREPGRPSRSRGRRHGRWRRPGKRSGTACAVIFRAAHGRPGSRSGLMRCGRGTRRRRRKKPVPIRSMPEAARSWDFFMKRADQARLRSALKGEQWAQVDLNEGHRLLASHKPAAVVPRAAETQKNEGVRP